MKKSIRLFLVLAMAFLMSLSFFFAGSMLAKADGKIDFGATDGASVYLAGDENDLGISYQIKVNKQDYNALKALPENANKTIAFGAIYSFAYKSSNEITFDSDFPVIANTDGNFDSLDDNYFVYDAELILDTDKIYEDAKAVDPTQVPTFEIFKAQLVTMPWIVKPFYAIYEGEFSSSTATIVYGELSSARMMLAVAAAVKTADEDVPSDFYDKYSIQYEETDYEVTLNAEGVFGGDAEAFSANTVGFIIGDSAELVLYEEGKCMAAFSQESVSELAPGGVTTITTIEVDQVNFSIKLACHKFTFVDEALKTVAIDANGKIFLNEADSKDVVFTSADIDGVNALKEDGTLDLALANKTVGDKFSLVLSTEDYNCVIEEAEVFDKVFENTAESRQEMRDLFSACGRVSVTSEGAEVETISGSYALAENIYFRDHSDLPSNLEESEQYDSTGATNELFANKGKTLSNTFAGSLNGRGFALNNIPIITNDEGTMFGLAGDGATFKNISFNGFKIYERRNGAAEGKFYYVERQDNFSKLFYAPSSKENEITFENVYIYDSFEENNSINYGYFSLVFFDFAADDTDKNTVAKMNFNNVIIDNVGGPVLLGVKGFTAVPANFTIENTYIATAGAVSRGAEVLTDYVDENEVATNFKKVSAVSEISDTQAFIDSGYWILVDGELVWKASYNTTYLVDSEEQVVSSLFFTEKDAQYSVVAFYNGEKVDASEITLEANSELVSISGNVITIGKGEGEVDVNVKYGGKVISTISIGVDTEAVITATLENVILSKYNGKLYFNDSSDSISIANIKDITYNGASVYELGKVDTTFAPDAEIGSEYPYDLIVETYNDETYSLKGVIVYTEVFENTDLSRTRMATLFGADNCGTAAAATYTVYDETGIEIESITADKIGTRTGHYALAEDLTFSEYAYNAAGEKVISKNEMFGGRISSSTGSSRGIVTFDATFDGRGHVLNNVIMDNNTGSLYADYYGLMFGLYSGPNAVLKNFAINGIKFYDFAKGTVGEYDFTTKKTGGLFFRTPKVKASDASNKSEISNVYVYVKATAVGSGVVSPFGLFYSLDVMGKSANGASLGIKKWSNVIINYEVGDLATNNENALCGIASYAGLPLTLETGLSMENVYFVLNGRPGYSQESVPEVYTGVKFYTTMDAMKNADPANDYSSFTSAYWDITSGVPVWKNIPVVTE